jgi:TolB-like protein/DNA-binding winged helix-turn-helix (wHTH) protein/tetratricopeptide (TPR) repeat protein
VPSSIYKFGPYELDSSRFELRCHDRPLKLEHIPTKLLILLLEKKGQVVSRQEIIERLWGRNVFLDTEHGINTSVRKIRRALKEDVERPRFIQTVSGKGYRFVPDEVTTNSEGTAASAKVLVPADEALTPASIEAGPITTRDGWVSRKWALAAVVLLFLAVSTLAFNVARLRDLVFAKNSIGPIHSVAVLPLANMSGDPSQDYYADGMTDELVTALAKNRNLRVVSRTSAMQYKDVHRPLREIGRELGVDGILEGSIERSQDRVHMTVQLIHAATDTHLWAESYDRDLNQAFSLPEELSAMVAKELKIATSPPPPRRYIDPGAHDAYLHGLHFRFGNIVRGGLPYFERAIQIQPDYATAWSGLSDTYGVLAIGGEGPSSEVSKQWESAARKAVELDDSLPEAHNSMALWYLFYARDWQHAETESLRSLALDRRYAEGYHVHSYILTVSNHIPEAIEEQQRGMSIDPYARPWALGYTYYHARRYEDAANELRLCIAAQPFEPNCHVFLSDVYHFLGRDNEAIAELEQSLPLLGKKNAVSVVQRAFERGGFAAVADWQADHYSNPWQNADDRTPEPGDRNRPKNYVSPFWRALATARAGRKAQTLQLLDEAYLAHDPRIVFMQNEPVFDFLHYEPRYQSLVRKLGLPPIS